MTAVVVGHRTTHTGKAKRSARLNGSCLLISLVLSCSVCLVRPDLARGQLIVTFQTGASVSTAAGPFDLAEPFDDPEEEIDYGFRTGLALRALASLPLRSNSGLKFGVAYTEKGMSLSYNEFFYEIDRLKLGYLEIPLLAWFRPSFRRAFSPQASAGPVLSILVRCRHFGNLEGIKYVVHCPNGLVLNESVDVGAMASVGMTFETSHAWSISLDLHYNHGLLSTLKTSETKNRSLAVMAGVVFPFRCRCGLAPSKN